MMIVFRMIILLLTLLELTQTNTHDVGGHDEPGPSLLEEVTGKFFCRFH